MSPTLRATRFELDPSQLAAALALNGTKAAPGSGLEDLPSVAKPDRILAGTSVLAKRAKSAKPRLVPEASATVDVLADPQRFLSVVVNRAGRPIWTESLFVHGGGQGPFVLQADQEGKYDLALIPSATEAVVLIDDMLALTALAAPPIDFPAELGLDLVGYAALLAGADHLQESRFRVRLERDLRAPPPLLTADALETQLSQGLSTTDTRWAVCAGRMVCPSTLAKASGRMVEGLKSLEANELIAKDKSGGYNFTVTGFSVADSLGQIVNTGGLSVGLPSSDGRVAVSHVSLFRSAAAIWVVAWSDVTLEDGHARVFPLGAPGAIRLVRGLLEPVELIKATPSIAPIKRAQKARAKQPAKAASQKAAWIPTHIAPQQGLDAWETPDANAEPVAEVEEGIEMKVLERKGAWARVTFENGWSAWVDGRELEEVNQ